MNAAFTQQLDSLARIAAQTSCNDDVTRAIADVAQSLNSAHRAHTSGRITSADYIECAQTCATLASLLTREALALL